MIDANPKVSVAISTCDQEAFIGDAITSALEQDYPALEIVVADDASRDGTPRIVSEFARRFPSVVQPLLHTGGRSIVANVNRALAACSGQFVATLDGDDVFLAGKLKAQVEAFEENPDVVLCRHPVEAFTGAADSAAVHTLDFNPGQMRSTAADLVAKGNFVAPASSMMRREAIPAAGVPGVIQHAPDWLLGIETARRGTTLRLPQVFARYRLHPGQITSVRSKSDVVFRDAMRTLTYVEHHYPDLAHCCPSGRRVITKWEAHRRLAGSQDYRWITAAIRAALRRDPTEPILWRALLTTTARRVASRVGIERPVYGER
jgi:glycosyltransferase involved in cell wall biosynthesis